MASLPSLRDYYERRVKDEEKALEECEKRNCPSLFGLPPDEAEPGAAPPPAQPGGAAPAPGTPPPQEETVCPKCKAIAQSIAEIDAQIAAGSARMRACANTPI